jgi:ATP-dependent helicase/nuclease subunit A
MDSADCITDSSAGVGLKIIDEGNGLKLSSLAWQAINQKRKEQNLAEEMRILYVAMTRAKDKLILSGAAESKNCRRLLSNVVLNNCAKLPAWLIKDAKSELDWVMLSLARYKKLNAHFELPVKVNSKDENLFDLKIYRPEEIKKLENTLMKKQLVSRYEKIKTAVPDKILLESITKNLSWQYPFEKTAAIKAKQTVTSLLQMQEQYGEAERDFSFESFEKPGDKTEKLVIGSATHLVIQNVNLKETVNESAIRKVITYLFEKGCITKQIAEKINISAILRFFDGDLGRLAQDDKNIVMKEWPFTYAASVSDLYPDLEECEDEKVIIQGIIDMLIKTPAGIAVIDFKTGKVSESGRLPQQLKWYCRAAGDILNDKIIGGYLYFLSSGKAVKVC